MHGTLIGNLTEDAKFSQGDRESSDRVEFRVAVDQGYGENKSTGFWDCQIWGKRAGALERLLTKGKLVAVTGVAEQREYQDREGANRRAVRVRVSDVKLLSFDRDDDRGS